MSMHSSQDPIVGIEVSNAVNTNNGLENCVYAAFLGGQGAKAGGIAYSKDASPTLKATSSGSNMVPNIVVSDVCGTLCASDGKGKNGQDAYDGKLIVEKDDHSGVNGFNFEMWTGEAKDISPTLQRKRTSDTLLYRDQCNEKKTPNTPKELEK